MTKTERYQVNQEPCRCVSCGACGGSGNIWLDMRITMMIEGFDEFLAGRDN